MHKIKSKKLTKFLKNKSRKSKYSELAEHEDVHGPAGHTSTPAPPLLTDADPVCLDLAEIKAPREPQQDSAGEETGKSTAEWRALALGRLSERDGEVKAKAGEGEADASVELHEGWQWTQLTSDEDRQERKENKANEKKHKRKRIGKRLRRATRRGLRFVMEGLHAVGELVPMYFSPTTYVNNPYQRQENR